MDGMLAVLMPLKRTELLLVLWLRYYIELLLRELRPPYRSILSKVKNMVSFYAANSASSADIWSTIE